MAAVRWMEVCCVSFLLVLGALLPVGEAQRRQGGSSCYTRDGIPRRCAPPFVNAAFNLPVEATNTCGLSGPSEYCMQTGHSGATKSCLICDARDPSRAHPSSYLTDLNNNDNVTWWQSDTMLEGMQYPNSVNLTLNLGKSFDITYVRLRFHSSRPESFAIYKRTHPGGPWIPYQYYSASCEDTYGKLTRDIITADDETKAICTNDYSDISPLTGGSIAFSTLQGRPGAFNFAQSPILQEWVTATEIRIVLDRMNTFGDEVFGSRSVLKSYYYAISDFAVGGICKCNGHASECERSTGQGLEERRVCLCEHFTDGPDCGKCLPFYNDQPWAPASHTDAHECKQCECNGLANRCFFDENLYRTTGHGGHCLECRENTAGPHCERCKDEFYRTDARDRCRACNCNPTGSESSQCDDNGRCRCKPGVTGEKCDRCEANYFDFGATGCRPCACEVAGSRDNNPVCIPNTGMCTCKENVEGQNCDRCKPGFFNLDIDNELGCQACFCFGHASVCSSAPGFSSRTVHSTFNSGNQRWTGADEVGREVSLQYNAVVQNIGLSASQGGNAYFVAPSRYLGDQRYSYNQDLTFTLRIGEDGASASRTDVILEGGGFTVSSAIYSQGNPVPRTVNQDFRFRLHEHPNYRWMPQIESFDFIRMLSNLTAIKIRASYTPAGAGFLDNVKLNSAQRGAGGSGQASHIEQCTCPEGYVGQFCESCAPGYHRDPPNGGPLARCVPCNCNGHSDACDVNTGRCICQHNTAGDNCEKCTPGYYGYALKGTPEDCQRCPCPDGGECAELLNGEVACINCHEGFTGNRCEMCADGYYGDPEGRYGPQRPCEKCVCNDNIDPNAVANCNMTTGECLKCIYNTGGFYCENCLPGTYGDALALPKGQCKLCDCFPPGSVNRYPGQAIGCDSQNGQCTCQRNVEGRKCDTCYDGYWNIQSGTGCERCECDYIGSFNQTCDVATGQCICQPGVSGRNCDSCQQYHYGFSLDGCESCDCSPEGSVFLQCDDGTGQCVCRENVEGRTCERCKENKYNISAGCLDCPACYNLVQERVTIHRHKLNELRILIENIGNNPQAINDTDFRRRISEVNETVIKLLDDARNSVGGAGPLATQLRKLKDEINELMMQCGGISDTASDASVSSDRSKIDISRAEQLIDAAEQALREAEIYIETEGKEALRKAKEAQERFGQQSQQMTEIAKQAREEADRQEREAMRIDQTAREALNTSEEAYRIAQEAISLPEQTAREINDLRRDVTDGERLYEQTKNLAERAKKQAEDAYRDSLGIYTDTDIRIPKVDVPLFKEEANEIKEEAREIKEKANELIEQNRDLMREVEKQKDEAVSSLNEGIRQQQIADELLSMADIARAIARDAVSKATQIIRDANETLDTLNEFDKNVQESKDEAEEALTKVPLIEQQIGDAEEKTRQANDNLANAEMDAILARDYAQEAQNIAEMASDDAGSIREEADNTKQRATDLHNKADGLAADVSDAEANLKRYEDQAETDMLLAQEALEKADAAKSSAVESSKKVSKALDDVNEILRLLQGLDSIDVARLDELEVNLSQAEQKLLDANLEDRYSNLVVARDQQYRWVTDYTEQLIQLQKDVENIHQINATIPRTCFQRVVLEPTQPSG